MRATYCKCKNTYTINKCKQECKAAYYWSQGIGSLKGQSIRQEKRIFDKSFDNTFN